MRMPWGLIVSKSWTSMKRSFGRAFLHEKDGFARGYMFCPIDALPYSAPSRRLRSISYRELSCLPPCRSVLVTPAGRKRDADLVTATEKITTMSEVPCSTNGSLVDRLYD